MSRRRQCTLASYYIEKYGHMIPDGVEIWECDASGNAAEKIYHGQ
jgi:hypothetical protein